LAISKAAVETTTPPVPYAHIFAQHGYSTSPRLLGKGKPRLVTQTGLKRRRWSKHLILPAMRNKRVRTGAKLKLDLRLSEELIKWLVGLAIGSGALSAAVHYL